MEKKESKKTEVIMLRLPKEQKEKIFKIVEKSSYNNASELIRAGIEKELNLQMYKDNLKVITEAIDKILDKKFNDFLYSQRKLTANNVRMNALSTYIMGEVMKRIMGDELHEEFLKIIKSGRLKANYYVSRRADEMTEEELLDFYNIGNIYRKE